MLRQNLPGAGFIRHSTLMNSFLERRKSRDAKTTNEDIHKKHFVVLSFLLLMSSGPQNLSRPSNEVTQGQRSRKQVTTNMTQQHALLCLSDSIGLEVLSHYTCFSGSRWYSKILPWPGPMRRGRLPCPGHHWHQTPAPADTHPRSPLQGGGHLNPGLVYTEPLTGLYWIIRSPPFYSPHSDHSQRREKVLNFSRFPGRGCFPALGVSSSLQWPVPVFTPTPSPLNSEYPVLLLLKLAQSRQHSTPSQVNDNY